jgi:hypothetical protein
VTSDKWHDDKVARAVSCHLSRVTSHPDVLFWNSLSNSMRTSEGRGESAGHFIEKLTIGLLAETAH